MSLDVKTLEDARTHISKVRSMLSEEADRQIFDTAIYIIDEELAILESDD